MLNPWASLCILVSVALAPTWHKPFFKFKYFNILHTLSPPTPICSENFFLLMRCTLSGVFAVWGQTLSAKSQILACPLSPNNLFAHQLTVLRSTAQFPYTFFNFLWLFAIVLFTQQSTLLLTNIKCSSHPIGLLQQRHVLEQLELNLSTSGKDGSMNSVSTNSVEQKFNI